MPKRQTICRARVVARSRSFSAPVVTSCKISSLAVGPPIALSTASQADLLSNAKKAKHLPGKSGGAFQVVLCAGGDLMEDFFFGGAPAQGSADAIENLRTAHEELLAGGHLHGVAEGCPAA